MAKTQKEIDNNARASVERSQKISMVYRKQQELDALQEELDSIAVKFNVNKTENTKILAKVDAPSNLL